jgi:hypothetical protein
MRRSPCVAADRALRADRHLGAAVGRAVRAHQRRRLERVGWLGALDAPGGDWAAGDPRPRPGGSLEVLSNLPRRCPGWWRSSTAPSRTSISPAGSSLLTSRSRASENRRSCAIFWPLFRPSRGTVARETRLRLWSEHLELPVEQVAGEPAQVIDDYWKPISKEQLARREAGEPLTHRLVRLPHLSRRSERLLGPLQGLLLDG